MEKKCIACEKTGERTPLIPFEYRNTNFWICPQHMPVLIHTPAKLVGKLPGAEDLDPAEGG
jgi:hypothetical protein